MAQTAAERRKAQRQVARKLKTGERILPREITGKARAVAGERKNLLNQIDKFKKDHYGNRPKWSEKSARLSTRINAETGERWTVEQLREIWKNMQAATGDQVDSWAWHDIFEETEDYASALYYH
jgi:hypothetical protein